MATQAVRRTRGSSEVRAHLHSAVGSPENIALSRSLVALSSLSFQLRGRDVTLRESWQGKRRSSGHTAAEQEEIDARYADEKSMMDTPLASFGWP